MNPTTLEELLTMQKATFGWAVYAALCIYHDQPIKYTNEHILSRFFTVVVDQYPIANDLLSWLFLQYGEGVVTITADELRDQITLLELLR